MKHIIEDWDQNIYPSALWDFYFAGLRTGVLDIETTGLNPSRNKFILGGVYDVPEQKLHQVLAETRAEEPAALAEYAEVLAGLDVVISYNGNHFDIPFLDVRMTNAMGPGSAGCCDHLYHLDLYRVLKAHSPIRKLVPNMRQKTVENYMGLWQTRADEISGAESVDLYNQYEATADPEAEARILLHNNDDVRQLTRLTKAITKSDFHKAMFTLGFPVKFGERLYTVNGIRLCRDTLEYSGIQNRQPADYTAFEIDSWPASCTFRSGTFRVSVPIIRQQGIAAVDLQAAGLVDTEGSENLRADGTSCLCFEDYPGCGSGFLVIEDESGIKYRETNHFIKEFTKKIMEECL